MNRVTLNHVLLSKGKITTYMEGKALVNWGRVTINGIPATDIMQLVPEGAVVKLDNVVVAVLPAEKKE